MSSQDGHTHSKGLAAAPCGKSEGSVALCVVEEDGLGISTTLCRGAGSGEGGRSRQGRAVAGNWASRGALRSQSIWQGSY